jgi:hypothetical protein
MMVNEAVNESEILKATTLYKKYALLDLKDELEADSME